MSVAKSIGSFLGKIHHSDCVDGLKQVPAELDFAEIHGGPGVYLVSSTVDYRLARQSLLLKWYQPQWNQVENLAC
jgi:hypothetical protein